ncbi:hypothetical protein GCM10027090_34720 [Sinomonas soli]
MLFWNWDWLGPGLGEVVASAAGAMARSTARMAPIRAPAATSARRARNLGTVEAVRLTWGLRLYGCGWGCQPVVGAAGTADRRS